MKVARFFVKLFFLILTLISILIFSLIFYLKATIGTDFKIKKGDVLSFDTSFPVTAVFKGSSPSLGRTNLQVGNEYDVNLKVFGAIPFNTVSVEVVDEMYVAVLGYPFGMRIFTKGVLITDLTEVQTKDGNVNPAKNAGLKVGDYILTVNGKEVTTNEDLSMLVERSNGRKMDFLIMRNNTKIHISVSAALSKETNTYKIGIWIKDSSAGIGTLTFYSPATDIICGLGHGICDEDTETLTEINTGQIVDAEIISVEKSKKGSPGQLNGRFKVKTLGDISYNSDTGVYSKITSDIQFKRYAEIALKQEVKNGKAEILCTLEDGEPKAYSCNIQIRSSAFHNKTQNMIITVTDKELLDKTGGIVQGMSGSPILQDGKLVGAVTHVLIDAPEKGYGIFAENMLETIKESSESNILKEAS